MEKVVLLSILAVNVGVPIRMAGRNDPARAWKRAVVICAAFDFAYVFALVFVVPRIFS